MNATVLMLALSLLLAQSGGSPGVHVWKAGEIAARGKALSKKLDAQKVASEVIATEGNRTIHGRAPRRIRRRRVAREGGRHHGDRQRRGHDDPWRHGGGRQDHGPGEIRGPSIKGGTEVRLTAGDVLHIPAKVAHQMKLDAGKHVTYFVTKVVE